MCERTDGHASSEQLPSVHYIPSITPDVQAGFRKGRGTRDQIANIHWIMEKGREPQTYDRAVELRDHLCHSYDD